MYYNWITCNVKLFLIWYLYYAILAREKNLKSFFITLTMIATFSYYTTRETLFCAGEEVECVSHPEGRESSGKSSSMEDGYGRTAYGNEKTKRRTGRTAAYRDKGGRKRGKVESNRDASTDLRETRMHEDVSAVGICFYYKVCKWRTRNAATAGVSLRSPYLCLSIPSYGDTVINWIAKARVTLLY